TTISLFGAEGVAGDFVRVALVGGAELHGVMRHGGVLYSLTTGRRLGITAGEPTLLIERVTPAELRGIMRRCTVSRAEGMLPARSGGARAAGRTVVRLALEADHAFTLRNGEGTNGLLLALADAVNALYEPLDMQFEVVFQRAWAVPDPYLSTVSGESLAGLRSYWEQVEGPAHPGVFTD